MMHANKKATQSPKMNDKGTEETSVLANEGCLMMD
jgi:hypothetical protein